MCAVAAMNSAMSPNSVREVRLRNSMNRKVIKMKISPKKQRSLNRIKRVGSFSVLFGTIFDQTLGGPAAEADHAVVPDEDVVRVDVLVHHSMLPGGGYRPDGRGGEGSCGVERGVINGTLV